MNDKEKSNLLGYLQQKKACLKSILDMTKERKFAVNEENVERIQNFLKKREPLIDNCKYLDKKIKEFIILDEDKNDFFYKDVQKIKSETDDIIREIVSLDKKNQKIMTELLQLIKSNIKNIKVSKQVKSGYDDFFQGQSYGSFDSKN